MSAPSSEDNALGTARGRFVASLPRKAVELRGAIALLTSTPAAIAPRDEMRRRLQTLYASALVFRDAELAELVKTGIERIDVAHQQGRALTDSDLHVLGNIVGSLPSLHPSEPGAAALTEALREGAQPTSDAAIEVQAALDAELPQVTDPALPTSPSEGVPAGPRVVEHPASAATPEGPEVQASPPSEPSLPSAPARLPTRPVAGAFSDAPPGVAITATAASYVRKAGAAAAEHAPLLQRVVRVLLLETEAQTRALAASLPATFFEVFAVHSPESALHRARTEGPDVVVAGRALAQQGDFLGRLRSEPLTDFLPVVLLQTLDGALEPVEARELGADEVLTWPTSPHALAECIGRVTGTLVDEGHALAALPNATLAEMAERVAEEIRSGLVEAAESGLDLQVPLGGGAEVRAAAWAAVARLRAFVSQQSGGRIRFRDLPTRGGPGVLALVEGSEPSAGSAEASGLQGRCVLVVDDDPSVVWFFAGLLREEGVLVLEAKDGREALEMARGRRPDVVISDILMPELDGFALCRALQRDPLLADVPVILLSWKEDLLHRMRELQVGARGYLRKESAAGQILARVREVLRTRAQLESSLLVGGEVRGTLEGIGLVPMLRSVARSRPHSRVTVRDAWNVFEVEVRGGDARGLTRTASDGSLSRGEAALPQLLGTCSARFTVVDSHAGLTENLNGKLDEVLARGAGRLGALIDAVSGGALMRVRRVEFDPEAYSLVQQLSPSPVRVLVEALHAGQSPAEILGAGDTSAQTLEAVLIDLARRGALRAVTDTEGADMVEPGLRERGLEARTTKSSSRPPAPSPELLAESLARQRKSLSTRPPLRDTELKAADDALEELVRSAPPPAAAMSIPKRSEAPGRPDDSVRELLQQPVAAAESAGAAPRTEMATVTMRPARRAQDWRWPLTLAALAVVGFVGARMLAPGAESPAAATPEQEQEADARLTELTQKGRSPATAPADTVDAPVATEEAVPGANLEPLPPGDAVVVPEDVGFQVYEGITDSTVEVGPGQGLLIVGAQPGGPTAMQVNGQAMGQLPLKLSLAEGLHELELQRGDSSQYLFVSIAAGKTWVLAKP